MHYLSYFGKSYCLSELWINLFRKIFKMSKNNDVNAALALSTF